MNLHEFQNLCAGRICKTTSQEMPQELGDGPPPLMFNDGTMEDLILDIQTKIQIFEAEKEPKVLSSDIELQEIQNDHERLKKVTIQDLRDLQDEFEKKLSTAKSQYEKDLAFVERVHEEKINQLKDIHVLDTSETVHQYQEEINYLLRQLKEQSTQQKKIKFRKLKNFFFHHMREAKKRVETLNTERTKMRILIKRLKTELYETKLHLHQTQIADATALQPAALLPAPLLPAALLPAALLPAPNYEETFQDIGEANAGGIATKHITKFEIQFFADTNETKNLINKSNEIKRKLDKLNNSGDTERMITDIVDDYMRIEMILNHFKNYEESLRNM